jgi:DNA-binding Lrp family transcriptional regulator
MIDKAALRQRALELAAQGGLQLGATLAAEFGISRQAAANHVRKLVEDGILAAQGATRNKRYHLADLRQASATYSKHGLREDIVWRELCAPIVADLPENVRGIWQYGVTEMVNNAIDHSGSPDVVVSMRRNALYTSAIVADHGEGIFLKIQRAFDLYDPREAILELAKGKLTTDPSNHTGEGIFFSSKMFDAYDIQSGALHFMHDDGFDDVLFERPKDAPGTLVFMRLDNDSGRTVQEVFDRFAEPDEFTFAKTVVPVKLAQYEGEKLVSRSQARRLTQRFERFQTVVLDFEGVAEIGQAFADEVFRVFRSAHPGTRLIPVNTTDAVANMVKRASNAAPA